MPGGRARGSAFPHLPEDVDFPFPEPSTADANGIVCAGGNLSPGLLLSAYRRGIFPWFSKGDPILWWSPDPRFVLTPESLHVSETMRKLLRRAAREEGFALSLDRDFEAVIRACSSVKRPRQKGTWITEDMVRAYMELHRLGFAHSAELRRGGRLIGGLYGVSLGAVFFGESMFSLEDDASKLAFIPLVWRLRDEGFTLVDAQVYTGHLAGLGAQEMPRVEFLRILSSALAAPTRRGAWHESFPGFPESSEYARIVRRESR